MMRFIYFCILLTLVTTATTAQEVDQFALKINGKPVYKSELEKAYQKSIKEKSEGEKLTLNQFVESYIDYKLNVEEAKNQKLDTTRAFKRDYASYKIMLSNSYLKDNTAEKEVVEMLFNRLQQNVELNHTILPFEKGSYFPADTLELYNKAMKMREKIVKNGFTGAEFKDNTKTPSIVMDWDSQNGYLGWIMALTLQPAVEDAAFTLPVNQISMPIRSVKGYHIIQVLGRRPSVGLRSLEQVTFNFSNIPPNPQQVDSTGSVAKKVYQDLKKSNDFQELCKAYNKVMETGAENCDFGVFTLNDTKIPRSFLTAAFNLQNEGDFSEPVISDYGYHIVRLKKIIPEPPFSDVVRPLTNNIMNSDRVVYYTKAWRDNQAKKYGLHINNEAYEKISKIAEHMNPADSGFVDKISNNNDLLYTIDNSRDYYVRDFSDYLKQYVKNDSDVTINQPIPVSHNRGDGLTTDKLKKMFSDFTSATLTQYADSTLEIKHTEFGSIMNEYAEGILLFDVKNRNIWRKASEDQKKLENYYKKNKKKYTWDSPKYKGILVLCKDEATMKKAEELLALTNGKYDEMKYQLTKSLNKDAVMAKVETGLWSKGINAYIDHKAFYGIAPKKSDEFPFYYIKGIKLTAPESIEDVKGFVVSDYQEVLEREWTVALRKKYKVEKDQTVINTLKQ